MSHPPKTPSKSNPKKPSYTAQLLQRAHSPTTAAAIHTEKFKHKPLILHSTSKPSNAIPVISRPSPKSKTRDPRTLRREARNAKLESQGRRRRKRPQPLSAAEKRRLCLYDIPKQERKYSIYVGLHRMWCAYMREVLGVQTVAGGAEPREVYLTQQVAGPLLVTADYHGAEIEVVRSRCVSRVGVKGIVVRDTKFTFEVITARDEIKTLPKEHSIFRFEVPAAGSDLNAQIEGQDEDGLGKETAKRFIFELHGDQFQYRPADRANKKFKVHIPPDL